MAKKILLVSVMLTLIITLNGCHSDDTQPDTEVVEVTTSSFSESEERTETEVSTEAEIIAKADTEEAEETTQEEIVEDIAETDTTTVSATTETPKSDDTAKNNKSDTANKSTEQTKSEETTSSSQTQPATSQLMEETYVKATKDDCKAVAQKILEYINSYRSTPATKLPGLTEYAEYRSRQLVSNFAHDTDDERAAATALGYGEYIDTALYGMDGEPYYEVNAREAIACGGYVGSVDMVAEKMALLVKNSSGHWAYVGSSDFSYIAVGVTYESGMWYCDIAVARENTDNN